VQSLDRRIGPSSLRSPTGSRCPFDVGDGDLTAEVDAGDPTDGLGVVAAIRLMVDVDQGPAAGSSARFGYVATSSTVMESVRRRRARSRRPS
jgi:hypothetical protein